jgi:hypothetical protein
MSMELRIAALVAFGLMLAGLAVQRNDTDSLESMPRVSATFEQPRGATFTCGAEELESERARLHELRAKFTEGKASVDFSTFPLARTPNRMSNYTLRFEATPKSLMLDSTHCILQIQKFWLCTPHQDECREGTNVTRHKSLPPESLDTLLTAFEKSTLFRPTPSEVITLPDFNSATITVSYAGGSVKVAQQSVRSGQAWLWVTRSCGPLLLTGLPELGPILSTLSGDTSDAIHYIDTGGKKPPSTPALAPTNP